MRIPIPTEGIVAICACAAFGGGGLCSCRSHEPRRCTDGLWRNGSPAAVAVGEQRSGLREVALSQLEGAFVRPAHHGPAVNHGRLVEFTLLKEHRSPILPGMWRFVESGKSDVARTKLARGESAVSGRIGRKSHSVQPDGPLAYPRGSVN